MGIYCYILLVLALQKVRIIGKPATQLCTLFPAPSPQFSSQIARLSSLFLLCSSFVVQLAVVAALSQDKLSEVGKRLKRAQIGQKTEHMLSLLLWPSTCTTNFTTAPFMTTMMTLKIIEMLPPSPSS